MPFIKAELQDEIDEKDTNVRLEQHRLQSIFLPCTSGQHQRGIWVWPVSPKPWVLAGLSFAKKFLHSENKSVSKSRGSWLSFCLYIFGRASSSAALCVEYGLKVYTWCCEIWICLWLPPCIIRNCKGVSADLQASMVFCNARQALREQGLLHKEWLCPWFNVWWRAWSPWKVLATKSLNSSFHSSRTGAPSEALHPLDVTHICWDSSLASEGHQLEALEVQY